MKNNTLFSVIGCVSAVVMCESAKAGSNIRPYIGLNFTYAHANLNDELGDLASYISGYDFGTDDLINPNTVGFTANIGAQFNKYLGAELFLNYTASTAEVSFYDNYATVVATMKNNGSSFGIGADVIGSLQISDSDFSMLGSIGGGYYNFKLKVNYEDYLYKYSDSGNEKHFGFRLGIGGQYAFTDNFAARTLVRYVIINSDEQDLIKGMLDWSIGLKCTF